MPLKISSALLFDDPSTYSEKKRSDEAARASGAASDAPPSAPTSRTTATTRWRRIEWISPVSLAVKRLCEILLRHGVRLEADTVVPHSPVSDSMSDAGSYSTVTVFARLRGWSTFSPRRRAIRYARSWSGTTASTAERNAGAFGT